MDEGRRFFRRTAVTLSATDQVVASMAFAGFVAVARPALAGRLLADPGVARAEPGHAIAILEARCPLILWGQADVLLGVAVIVLNAYVQLVARLVLSDPPDAPPSLPERRVVATEVRRACSSSFVVARRA
jgi:hypothetical protein